MNFRQNLLATCLLAILFVKAGFTQNLNYKRLTLRSDFPAKTVMVSNANQEMGIRSPFLVAATMKDNDRKKEYRSLLQFNYDHLPQEIMTDPLMIATAHLVLFPANADFLSNRYNEPGQLVIRRITGNWNDSITAWDNQPMVDSTQFAAEKIKIRKKDWEVRIDVTDLVKEMILHGNQGFMICQDSPVASDSLTGLSFASSLNDNKRLRPLLVIVYSDGTFSSPALPSNRNRPVSAPVYMPPRVAPSSSSGTSNRSE